MSSMLVTVNVLFLFGDGHRTVHFIIISKGTRTTFYV